MAALYALGLLKTGLLQVRVEIQAAAHLLLEVRRHERPPRVPGALLRLGLILFAAADSRRLVLGRVKRLRRRRNVAEVVVAVGHCSILFAARLAGLFMANIASQKKRNARTERERAENLRFRSSVKTHFKRLESALQSGNAETIASEHKALVSRIDKAVQKGALHRNTGARKKSRAAGLVGTAAK